MIEVDNILKAAGKTTKGKEGGFIKVVQVNRQANGTVQVRFEFEAPGQQNFPGGAFPGFPGAFPINPPGIQIQPPLPPQALPPQKAPAPGRGQGQAPAPPQPGAQARLQAQPAQAQARPALQIRGNPLQGGGGFGGMVIMGGFGNQGFSMVDDKGGSCQLVNSGMFFRQVGQGQPVMEQVLAFRVPQGRNPAKLQYSTQKMTTIEIPFTLKDITIP